MKAAKIIFEGKLNKNLINSSNFHPYLKEALNSPEFDYIEKDMQTTMENKAYECFAGIACKALIDVFGQSHSLKNLQNFKAKLYGYLKEN